jgi:hypothetical protein
MWLIPIDYTDYVLLLIDGLPFASCAEACVGNL